jgi:hypothetical protein
MRRWPLTIGMVATAIGAAWLAPRLLPPAGEPGVEDVEADAPAPIPAILTYRDRDGDGFGDEVTRRLVRGSPPPGHVTAGGDCDDGRASTHPGAVDVPGDGLDQDCDGRDRAVSPADQIPELDAPPVVPLPVEPDVDWDRIEPACGMG